MVVGVGGVSVDREVDVVITAVPASRCEELLSMGRLVYRVAAAAAVPSGCG